MRRIFGLTRIRYSVGDFWIGVRKDFQCDMFIIGFLGLQLRIAAELFWYIKADCKKGIKCLTKLARLSGN